MDPSPIPGGALDRLRDALGTRERAWVVAGAVAVVALGGTILWLRGAPVKIAPPATDHAAMVASPSAVAGVVVHVAGKVRAPGLYTLPEGARVADAIEAAGGPTRKADLDLLNLAEVLLDGTKVEVLGKGAAAVAAPGVAGETAISINSADQVTLEQIPGIGPVKAGAIVAYRDEAGSFTSIEQLLEVTGIGPATLEALRPYVTL